MQLLGESLKKSSEPSINPDQAIGLTWVGGLDSFVVRDQGK
jgi:hypothetical protein